MVTLGQKIFKSSLSFGSTDSFHKHSNTMDLKHSSVPEVTVVADAYMPGSKSSDLIKPPINGSNATLDKPALPPGKLGLEMLCFLQNLNHSV